MIKLSDLAVRIIQEIAKTYPYKISEVEMVFRRCNSFDKTIKILDNAIMFIESLDFTIKRFGH